MSGNVLSRLRLFLLFTIVVLGILSARLAHLQIMQGSYYRHLSEENRLRVSPVMAPRGEVFDRHGETLVTNRTGFTISLEDAFHKNREEVLSFLSQLLEVDESDINRKIEEYRYRRYLPIPLKKDVDMETIAKIEEKRMDLPGVLIEVQPIRVYPLDNLASHILGFTGEGRVSQSYMDKWEEEGYSYRYGDVTGQDGIELVWESFLRGQDGEILVEANSVGRPIRTLDKRDPLPGHNLYLTLDAGLQRDTEQFLKEQLTELQEEGYEKAQVASAVVLEVKSGRVLAMASYPDYNPNTLSQDFSELITDPLLPLFNRSLKGTYPGGSTFKLVTAAAALEEGKVSPRELVRCYGSLSRYGVTKRCYHGTVHGAINLHQAIVRSCNVFFYEMGLRVGIDNLAYYAEEFGFGRRTGLRDIPGESAGTVASRETKIRSAAQYKTWVPGETMDASIGQGYHGFTPLQLANYAAVVANEGLNYRTYLVEKIVSHRGEEVWKASPDFFRINVSDGTLDILKAGMEGVTRPGGTAGFLSRLPIQVAGKTGSAETGKRDSAGNHLPTHGVFVGYAPAQDPEIAFSVIIEHGGTGGRAAAPVAEKIVKSYFGLWEKEDTAEEPVQEGDGVVSSPVPDPGPGTGESPAPAPAPGSDPRPGTGEPPAPAPGSDPRPGTGEPPGLEPVPGAGEPPAPEPVPGSDPGPGAGVPPRQGNGTAGGEGAITRDEEILSPVPGD